MKNLVEIKNSQSKLLYLIRSHPILLAIITWGSVLRIFVCLNHHPMDYLWSDPGRHWDNGNNFLGETFFGASDPVVYQAYVWLLRAVTVDNRLLIGIAVSVLSVFMPWIYYRAAREFGVDKKSGLMAWAILSWVPSLFVIYHYFMMETLLLPLVGFALWMTGRNLRKKTQMSYLVSVIVWMIGILTKLSVVPLAAVCLAYSWWQMGRSWRLACLGVGLAGLMMIPSAIRSHSYFGFYAPFGNLWIHKILHSSQKEKLLLNAPELKQLFFVSPSSRQMPLFPISHWSILRLHEVDPLKIIVDFKEGSRDWEDAYNQIELPFSDRLRLHFENVVLFLFSPSWPDSDRKEWDGWLNFWTRWMWAPLIFFVLKYNTMAFQKNEWELLPLATTLFILFLMFQNSVTMEGRYRKPLEPLLILNVVWIFRKNRTQE